MLSRCTKIKTLYLDLLIKILEEALNFELFQS